MEKREREAGPSILDQQIRALGAMDEAFGDDNSAHVSQLGQDTWHMALATLKSQCPICSKEKDNCHFPMHITPTLPIFCLKTWQHRTFFHIRIVRDQRNTTGFTAGKLKNSCSVVMSGIAVIYNDA